MNFFLQALDINNLIQELDLSKVVIIANSMGAKTAMTFALTYPASLESLVAVDISPWPKRQTLGEKFLPGIVAGLRAMDLSLVKDRRDADKMLMDIVPVSKFCQFSEPHGQVSFYTLTNQSRPPCLKCGYLKATPVKCLKGSARIHGVLEQAHLS